MCPVCKSEETLKIVDGAGRETDIIHSIPQSVPNQTSQKVEFVICNICKVSYARLI